jgi:hypothetical protein
VAAILYTEIRKISALTCKVDFHVHWTSLIGHRANQITLLTGLVLLSVFALFMGLTQFSTLDMPGNDSFYHIKMAYLMRTESLKPDFIWLPLTILNPREFYDHHFLFHILLIPFTFRDLVTGPNGQRSFSRAWHSWSFGACLINRGFRMRLYGL